REHAAKAGIRRRQGDGARERRRRLVELAGVEVGDPQRRLELRGVGGDLGRFLEEGGGADEALGAPRRARERGLGGAEGEGRADEGSGDATVERLALGTRQRGERRDLAPRPRSRAGGRRRRGTARALARFRETLRRGRRVAGLAQREAELVVQLLELVL